MADYQLAATELALARAKADRGVLGPAALDARARSLLTLMHIARHAFTRRVPDHRLTPAPWASAGSALRPDDGRF